MQTHFLVYIAVRTGRWELKLGPQPWPPGRIPLACPTEQSGSPPMARLITCTTHWPKRSTCRRTRVPLRRMLPRHSGYRGGSQNRSRGMASWKGSCGRPHRTVPGSPLFRRISQCKSQCGAGRGRGGGGEIGPQQWSRARVPLRCLTEQSPKAPPAGLNTRLSSYATIARERSTSRRSRAPLRRVLRRRTTVCV